MTRNLGIVKWFNKEQGYGFIKVLDGEYKEKDIFVHYSSLRSKDSQYRFLVQGEYIEFIIDTAPKDNHEYQAMDVTGLFEGPLMYETRQIALSTRPPRSPHAAKEGVKSSSKEDDEGFRRVVHGRNHHRHSTSN